MKKPPLNPNEPIIRKSDFKKITIEASAISASALGVYLYGIMRYGMGPKAGEKERYYEKRFYKKLAAYGHVGRMDIGLPWELVDKAYLLKCP